MKEERPRTRLGNANAQRVANAINEGNVAEAQQILQGTVKGVGPKRAQNITDSVAVSVAQKDQATAGYNADQWNVTTLKPGDKVYGGVPGQSAYYTTAQTVEASGLNAAQLFQSLQVNPHPVYGYRPQVQEYIVQQQVRVPGGNAIANPSAGVGGGDQFFIQNFGTVLQSGPVTNLTK